MRRHFNPRLKVVKVGYWNVAASMHGIRVDDFEAVIALCEAHIASPYPEYVVIDKKPDHQEWRKAEYERNKRETKNYHDGIRHAIAYAREHMKVVNGLVNLHFSTNCTGSKTVRFSWQRDPETKTSRWAPDPIPLTFAQFQAVLVSAALQWSEVYDSEHPFTSGVRTRDFLINRESEYGPPPPADARRIRYMLDVLDQQRQAMYFSGRMVPPNKGGFANLLRMDPNLLHYRKLDAKERKKRNDQSKRNAKHWARKKAQEEALEAVEDA